MKANINVKISGKADLSINVEYNVDELVQVLSRDNINADLVSLLKSVVERDQDRQDKRLEMDKKYQAQHERELDQEEKRLAIRVREVALQEQRENRWEKNAKAY